MIKGEITGERERLRESRVNFGLVKKRKLGAAKFPILVRGKKTFISTNI